MPLLRSKKRKTELEKEEEEKPETTQLIMSKNKIEEITQWVMIGPNELFAKDDITFSTLPHPQNGVVSLYAFKDKNVYELMKFKEPYRSWLINETVQKDGSLTMLTPIDPLFLVIPFLERSAIKGNFSTLDNILMDDTFTHPLRSLESCLNREILEHVCDCKGSDDLIVYKANYDKIINWLSKKIEITAEFLQNSSINVKHGAQISGFVRTSDGKKNEDDCLRYAWEMITDYITEERSLKLKEKFSIKDAIKPAINNSGPPVAKRQKLNNDSGECLEDYRDTKSIKKKPSTTPTLSRTQKKLNKIDKKGMKTMSSFFAAKPKK